MNSAALPRSPWNVRYFLFLYLLPGNQLVFWKATVLPSATSASPQRTVRSSLSPSTMQSKWFFFLWFFFLLLQKAIFDIIGVGFHQVSKIFFFSNLLICLFRSGIFRSTIVWSQWTLRKVASVVALPHARTPLLCNLFMLPLTAWLCCPWRGLWLSLCPLFMKEPSPVLCIYLRKSLLIYFCFYVIIFIIAHQCFSGRFGHISFHIPSFACLPFIFHLAWQAAPSRSTHYLSWRARDLLWLLRGISSGCQLRRGICGSHPNMNCSSIKTCVFFVRGMKCRKCNYLHSISGHQSLGFWHRAPGFWVWQHAHRHMHDLWSNWEKVEARHPGFQMISRLFNQPMLKDWLLQTHHGWERWLFKDLEL